MIQFGEAHNTVVGMTRSGKTYAVRKSAEKVKQGVFFFNVQQEEVGAPWITATGQDDASVIIKALRRGAKINFLPDRGRRWQQLRGIVRLLYQETEKSRLDVYVIFDEIHLADKEALKAAIEVATTGLRWGIKAIFISQRPALIDNTLMNQSTKFVFFKTTLEKRYLENYGLPYEQISQGLNTGGQYSYMEFDFHELRGPYRV